MPPGRLLVAAHLALIAGGPAPEALASLFKPESLCVIRASNAAAHSADHFVAGSDKFTRLLIRMEGATRFARAGPSSGFSMSKPTAR